MKILIFRPLEDYIKVKIVCLTSTIVHIPLKLYDTLLQRYSTVIFTTKLAMYSILFCIEQNFLSWQKTDFFSSI